MALAAAALVPIDGEDAMRRSEGFLKAAGVRGPYRIHTLFLRKPERYPSTWYVGFNTADGPVTVEIDPKNARLRALQTDKKLSMTVASNQPPGREGSKMLWATLRRLGYGKDVRILPKIGFEHGPTGADFHILVHGLPFFNINPTYAHWLTIFPDGSVGTFRASPDPPQVNAWKPMVDREIALEALKAWGHRRAVAKGMPKEVDPSEGDLRPELGYWKFEHETKARLVWRASKYTEIQGKLYGLGALRAFVDAIDGRIIEPDDPAMGANP